MGRRYAGVLLALLGGLAACDSSIIKPLLPTDDAGPADTGPTPDSEADEGVAIDRGVDDIGPDVGSHDAGDPDADRTEDASTSDADPDGALPLDVAVDGQLPIDAGPNDMAPIDAVPDLAPPEPDLGPLCLDDTDCDGICGEDGRCQPCEAREQCPGGRCEDGNCMPCRDRADCGGAVCEEGVCRSCVDRGECEPGEVCVLGLCGPCAEDAQCGPGVCLGGSCAPCDPADHRGCGPAALCCPGEGQGGCVPTDPATGCTACGVPCAADDSDGCTARACTCGQAEACGGDAPYCTGDLGDAAPAVCVECRDDADCPEGQLCADDACVPATVIDAMAADPALEAMLEFIAIAARTDDLAGRAAVTVFAPETEAFGTLSNACLNAIVMAAPRFVQHHTLRSAEVLTAELLFETADALPEGVGLLMESNIEALVRRDGDGVVVLDELPVLRSLTAGNGVVHVLGTRVLLTDPYDRGCEVAP